MANEVVRCSARCLTGAHSRRPVLRMRGLVRSSALRLRNQLVLAPTFLFASLLVALQLPALAAALVVAGIATYGGAVARDLTTGGRYERWLEHPLEVERREELDAPGQLETILGYHEEIRAQIRAANPLIRGNLIDIFVRCTELAFEAARLEQQAAGLACYLSRRSKSSLEDQYVDLADRAETSRDSEAGATTNAAAQHKFLELTRRSEIEVMYDRVRARISLIEVTLEAVDSTLVKLRAHDLESSARARMCVDDNAEALIAAVTDLEECLVEALQG